jgi:hypothetical protein
MSSAFSRWAMADSVRPSAASWRRSSATSASFAEGYCSFRRSAVRYLENARVPQSEAAQVVGHERAGITFGTYNPDGLGMKALREVVERIGYKGVQA